MKATVKIFDAFKVPVCKCDGKWVNEVEKNYLTLYVPKSEFSAADMAALTKLAQSGVLLSFKPNWSDNEVYIAVNSGYYEIEWED